MSPIYGSGEIGLLDDLRRAQYTYGVPGQGSKYTKTTAVITAYSKIAYGREIWVLLKDGTEAVFEEPDDLGADNVTTRGDLEKYRADLYTFRRGKKNYIDDKAKVFGLIMGRCHPTMKSKVESDQDFPDLEKNDDVVGLLKKLKKLAYSTGNNC